MSASGTKGLVPNEALMEKYRRTALPDRRGLSRIVLAGVSYRSRLRAWWSYLRVRCGSAVALLVALLCLSSGAGLLLAVLGVASLGADLRPWFGVLAGYALLLALLPRGPWAPMSALVAWAVATAALWGIAPPNRLAIPGDFPGLSEVSRAVLYLLGSPEREMFFVGVLLSLGFLALRTVERLTAHSRIPHVFTPIRGGGPGWGLQGARRRLGALPLVFVVLCAVAWPVLVAPVLLADTRSAAAEAWGDALAGLALILPLLVGGAMIVCAPRFRGSAFLMVVASGGVFVAALLAGYPVLRPALDIGPVWSGYREVLGLPVARAVEFALLPLGGSLSEQVLAGLVLILIPTALVSFQGARALLRWL